MRSGSFLNGLQFIVFAWILTSAISNADAQPSDAHVEGGDTPSTAIETDDWLVRNTVATETARKDTSHPRAKEIRSSKPVQPFPQRPASQRDTSKKRDAQEKARSISGDVTLAVQALETYKAQHVELSLRSGERILGSVDYFTDDAVLIITHQGSLHIVELGNIQAIHSAPVPAPEPLRLSEDARAQLQSQQQRDIRAKIRDYRLREAHQHIGRPMRIIGGTLLGLGAVAEVWGLTVLTTSSSDVREEDAPFGNSLGVPAAIVGAPLIVGGISLIIGANLKRNRAIREAQETNITYSVSPKFMRDGMGVEGVVRF